MKNIRKIDQFLNKLKNVKDFSFIKHNYPLIIIGLENRAGSLNFATYIEELIYEGRENKWKDFPKMICPSLLEMKNLHEGFFGESVEKNEYEDEQN